MAFECQKAWKVSSGLADDAWDEEITSSPQVSSPHFSLIKEAGNQSKSSGNIQKPSLTITDISHQTHCRFLELPPVIIAEIFNHLNPRDLSIVSCVCRLFWRISSDSHGWKEFYCERWGLPVPLKASEMSALAPEKSWRELYVEREARSKAFLGRFKVDALHGHTEPIRSVCLLASANIILTAGYDTVIRMWNMEEGLLIDHSCPLLSTIRAIAADTEMLAVGGTEAFVRCWRAVPELPHLFDISGRTGKSTEFCLRGHVGPITCLGLDQTRIYSGSWDMSIRIWDRASLKCLKILRHGDWVWALVTRGPNVVSTAGSDMYTWDVETGQQIRIRLNVHVGNAYALQCSRSGHLLFTGGEDGAIHMFEGRSPRHHTSHSSDGFAIIDKPIASWVPHSSPVYSLAFEDPWLVSASGDGKLAMMDVRKLLKLGSNAKSKIDIDNRGQWQNAAIITLQTEPPQRLLHGFYKNLYSVDIGAERMVCGGEEGIVRIWDFTQALETERRVQASRNIRLENRQRRKKAQAATFNKSKQVDPYTAIAKSCESNVGGNSIWQRHDDRNKVNA
uniref:F-box domain-containing protein n=1 Tax=Araucaria cunninghamii TaxID=56994 RepID=A0A0D6R1I0_ARACU